MYLPNIAAPVHRKRRTSRSFSRRGRCHSRCCATVQALPGDFYGNMASFNGVGTVSLWQRGVLNIGLFVARRLGEPVLVPRHSSLHFAALPCRTHTHEPVYNGVGKANSRSRRSAHQGSLGSAGCLPAAGSPGCARLP